MDAAEPSSESACGMESVGMERTNTFNARMEEVLAMERELSDALRQTRKVIDGDEGRMDEDWKAAEAADRELERERREFDDYFFLNPERFSADDAELAFIGDLLSEERGEIASDLFVEEAIIGRKVHHDKLYYKVCWRGRNFVTWELEENIDNKKMIQEFEAVFLSRAMMPRTSRLRPATYVSRRLAALKPEMRQRIESIGRGQAVWSCEVEPYIWIPYEDELQRTIENAYRNLSPVVVVRINNAQYQINFETMVQRRVEDLKRPESTGGAKRPVLRQCQLPPAEERRLLDSMTLDELKQYIASIPVITPLHYEALQRLHDLDKVPVHATKQDLTNCLHIDTFSEVMNHICDGREYPSFSTDCFVCLEDYGPSDELAHLICGHFFHKKCAIQYFEKYSKLCPVCKEQIM